ncbi:DUF4276 family protein [Rhodoferax fermentans]|uniref:DUF4276 family protein n=1 Tax=Rhodoferax fermentans TaxID=28066 RepID=A0A1T1AWK7_RHOFE|nr:DUF4276 family protein [Rhodoferax fermentans]MBK1684818.1 DUF4276 domain-containing protein [Rhodoferax fermentans]OOV08480.1 hypothetical protein RF819_18845 [Rhodoferax fermentans]
MSRLYVLVEGQTEEAFVRELLVPHYAGLGRFLTPIIVSTSPGYKGGVVSYAKVKPQIVRLCRQDPDAHVTTMFDLYALPADFPGKAVPAYAANATGHQKALFLEAQLTQDINQPNFLANLMVHEYEALLFTQPDLFSQWSDDAALVSALKQALAAAGTPEDINDGPQTAPSKRILAAMPGYQKTFHGPLIACDIGLDAIRQACPHFHGWLQAIEALL